MLKVACLKNIFWQKHPTIFTFTFTADKCDMFHCPFFEPSLNFFCSLLTGRLLNSCAPVTVHVVQGHLQSLVYARCCNNQLVRDTGDKRGDYVSTTWPEFGWGDGVQSSLRYSAKSLRAWIKPLFTKRSGEKRTWPKTLSTWWAQTILSKNIAMFCNSNSSRA